MSDTEDTRALPPADGGSAAGDPGPKRLLRSRSDRMLGGVAGGLGDLFGVDPLIFRIGFAISVLFGGLGAFAYLAILLFTPALEDDGTVGQAPVQRSRWLAAATAVALFIFLASWGIFDGDPFWFDGGPGPWFFGGPILLVALIAGLFYLVRTDRPERHTPAGILGVIAIAIGSAIGISTLALLAAWAGATGSGAIVASVIIAIGALLVVAAFRGGARWLIVPALALAAPLGAVAAADVSFDGGIGDRTHRPAETAAIPEGGYELGVGSLKVDLRDLEWQPDTVLDLDVDLGMGEIVVAVPETVCVTGELRAGIGAVSAAGDESGGFDVSAQPSAADAAVPRIVLDARTDIGAVRVVNDDDAELRGHGPWDHDASEDEMRDAQRAACAEPEPEPSGERKRR